MNTFLLQLSGQAENRFYGHIHVLAKYCGLSDVPWLNGYLQHGWNATDGFGNYLGSKRLADKFVWSKRCENVIKSNGVNNVIAIGAPWIYLDESYPQNKDSKKEGVIVYPAHNSVGSNIGDTSLEYAIYLKNKYGSTTVVLHKYDYLNQKIVKNYQNEGHTVTWHGNGTPWEKDFDPNFLIKQKKLLNEHEIVVSNVMSTAILYGLSLGLDVELGGPFDGSITNKDDLASQIGDGKINWNNQVLNKNKLWQDELGFNLKKDSTELLQILNWDNLNKKRVSFLIKRAIDIFTGTNKKVTLNVLKKSFKKA